MSIYQQIKERQEAFIIAEIGVNFYDIAKEKNITLMEAAKLMIKEAYENGANAAKFQSYKAETLASKYSPAYWDQSEEPTNSQFELFKKFDAFGVKEYEELAGYCKALGIIFLSTPFDFESADYLDDLMEIYKISSSDLSNLPFIEHIAQKGKPVFLSTGAATIEEIQEAVNTIHKTGNNEICIMHCVLSYPTNFEDANLNMIKHLHEVFPEYPLGFSDHTRPDDTMLVLTIAFQYGAKVIEKHFTLDKSLPGNDHYHAMDPEDLKKFCNNIKLLQKLNGQYHKQPLACEQESRKQARRSIVAKVDIAKGEVVTADKVAFKRPGTGISPKELNEVLGKQVKYNIEKDKVLQWEDF